MHVNGHCQIFVDPLTFHLAPSSEQNSSVKYIYVGLDRNDFPMLTFATATILIMKQFFLNKKAPVENVPMSSKTPFALK